MSACIFISFKIRFLYDYHRIQRQARRLPRIRPILYIFRYLPGPFDWFTALRDLRLLVHFHLPRNHSTAKWCTPIMRFARYNNHSDRPPQIIDDV